jgi:hypothetical protein
MTAASQDPHKIQSELEGAEEYQAPPREHEQNVEQDQQPSRADDPVIDLTLLESQQGRSEPDMSETKKTPSATPGFTVSGKDELADPDNPGAPPPGERM